SAVLPLRAQPQAGADGQTVRPLGAEDQNQTELLRSYIQLREQLHATQMAVANSRVEAETAARIQAAALSEKLEAIKTAMDSERERQQTEAARQATERERQEVASQESQRTFIWVACIFGGLGVLTMLLVPFFQWRALNRVIDGVAARSSAPAPLPAANVPALGAGAAALDQAVELSNQRLMSVIDRVEQRVIELEQTATRLPPATQSEATTAIAFPHVNGGAEAPGGAGHAEKAADPEEDPRIVLLLAKGRQLLLANKAREALTSYDEILKIDPNHAEALVRKGATLERLKRDEEAIWCYDRAIEANQNLTLAYLHKGGVYNRQGRYDDALQCYEQALQNAEDSA
ncbi:MAG: tetratricopeptide repeat protein, partial [Opitutaceae bacterium]|nr:tetratricopeptide repeat protein [Opitutaceae bacterium]